MNFYAQPGVHANHSKKKSTISTNSPALSRKKKQRPKHPCKKYYASVARTPSARQTKEVDVPDAMPWVEKISHVHASKRCNNPAASEGPDSGSL
jgi:hypothetical protein